VQFSKLHIGAVVAFACTSLTISPAPSQTATQSQPALKRAKDRGSTPSTETNTTGEAASGGMSNQRSFLDCLETWDKATHMTKQEWRRTCERTIREYPELSHP
jgi:hypothetical protein